MAGITYRDGGTNRAISAVTYQDGATKRTIKAIWYGDGATKRQVFSSYTPMAVTVADVNGNTTAGVTNDTIGIAAINVTGGSSPFTYSTVYKSGTSFTLSNASTASPRFNRAGNPPAGTVSGTYTATVTDATGASASKDFTVTDDRL